MVRGELDMTVAFPGLKCDMVLVVASIGLEGLLGTEALQWRYWQISAPAIQQFGDIIWMRDQ